MTSSGRSSSFGLGSGDIGPTAERGTGCGCLPCHHPYPSPFTLTFIISLASSSSINIKLNPAFGSTIEIAFHFGPTFFRPQLTCTRHPRDGHAARPAGPPPAHDGDPQDADAAGDGPDQSSPGHQPEEVSKQRDFIQDDGLRIIHSCITAPKFPTLMPLEHQADRRSAAFIGARSTQGRQGR